MPKRQGEYTAKRASRLLRVHYKTFLRWCHEALSGRARVVTRVRRDITGHIFVCAEEIDRLVDTDDSTY